MTILSRSTLCKIERIKGILPFIFSIILTAFIVGAYHNILYSPFLFDDLNNIVNNPTIKIDKLDTTSFRRIFSEEHPTRTRPVANLSFALNYLVGGDDPLGYHLVNILIHIVTSLAVFRLFYLYLRNVNHSSRESLTLAFTACLVWALNPIQTNAVTYIVQRMTSLSAMFMIVSLLMYFQARILSVGNESAHYRSRIYIFSLMSLLFWGAAVMTKEIAFIMPILFLLHEIFFFGGISFVKIKNRKWLYMFAALCLSLVTILFIGPERLVNLFAGYKIRDFTLLERLLTEPRVVLHYMSLFLLPLPTRLMLYYDYPISQSLFVPPSTFLSIVALSSLLFLAVCYAKRFGLLAFGILWTLICLVIESSVFPLEIIFEHRFYLPSVGFSLALVYAAFRGLKYIRLNNIFLTLLFVAIVPMLAVLTYTRNETWKNEIDFNLDSVKKAPVSVRSHMGLALAYLNVGDYEQGRSSLEKAYELDMEHVVVLANLFMFYSNVNAHDRAFFFLSGLKKSIAAGNFACNQGNALDPVARTLFNQKRYSDAAFILETLTQCRVPAVVFHNLAICYLQTGNNRKAIQNFELALKLKPKYPYYLYQLSYLYYLESDHENALKMFHQLKEETSSKKSEQYIRELESLLER